MTATSKDFASGRSGVFVDGLADLGRGIRAPAFGIGEHGRAYAVEAALAGDGQLYRNRVADFDPAGSTFRRETEFTDRAREVPGLALGGQRLDGEFQRLGLSFHPLHHAGIPQVAEEILREDVAKRRARAGALGARDLRAPRKFGRPDGELAGAGGRKIGGEVTEIPRLAFLLDCVFAVRLRHLRARETFAFQRGQRFEIPANAGIDHQPQPRRQRLAHPRGGLRQIDLAAPARIDSAAAGRRAFRHLQRDGFGVNFLAVHREFDGGDGKSAGALRSDFVQMRDDRSASEAAVIETDGLLGARPQIADVQAVGLHIGRLSVAAPADDLNLQAGSLADLNGGGVKRSR